MNPHEMTLGSPNPRKLMLASVRIAHPTASEPYRKDSGSTLGAMCTNIVRTWLAPSTRAASTDDPVGSDMAFRPIVEIQRIVRRQGGRGQGHRQEHRVDDEPGQRKPVTAGHRPGDQQRVAPCRRSAGPLRKGGGTLTAAHGSPAGPA